MAHRRLTQERLEAALRVCLTNRAMQTRAAALGALLQAADRASAALAIYEKVLRSAARGAT